MTLQDTDDRLAQLEARFEAERASLKDEHASLKDEVTRLRAANLEMEGWRRSQDHPDGEANGATMSRSRFLRMGGAAAAGAVAAGASGLLSAKPAAALTGDALRVGQSTYPSSPAPVTRLGNSTATALAQTLFQADNASDVLIAPPTARVAILGTTNGYDPTGQQEVGVWGQTEGRFTTGVVGRAGTTGADPQSVGGGVVGASVDGGLGVVGLCNGPLVI